MFRDRFAIQVFPSKIEVRGKMKYETIVVGALETNCYLMYCEETRKGAVVDPGADPDKIFQVIDRAKIQPVILINTHGHIDHIGANKDIKDKYGIPLYIHEGDKEMLALGHQSEISIFLGAKESPAPDEYLKEGDEIKINNSFLKVIHTPGHSPGSVCLLGDGLLLSGDTLFNMGVGRTDLPGGSWEELERSIRSKIFALPEDIMVLPGHGPSTTVGREKNSNPFIR
jgi:glyoxylase-like metal-dependent hydrolase (beta-lactamase superfamily II)